LIRHLIRQGKSNNERNYYYWTINTYYIIIRNNVNGKSLKNDVRFLNSEEKRLVALMYFYLCSTADNGGHEREDGWRGKNSTISFREKG